MFGDPTFVKDKSQVFHIVWTYMVKDLAARKKARMACDVRFSGSWSPLELNVVAKFMSYNKKLPLAGNCENLRIRIFEFLELN
jgi:hypothetical protein